MNLHYLKHDKIRTAISAGAVRSVALLLGLAVSVALARNLGPEAYGTYGLVISVATILALPLHAGLPAYLMREVVRQRIDKNWSEIRGLVTRILQWIVVGGLFIVMILLGLWIYVGKQETESMNWYLLVASPLIPLIAMNSTRVAVLRGFKKVLLSQLPQNFVQPTIQILLIIGAVYFWQLSIATAISALVVSSLFSVVAASILIDRYVVIPTPLEPAYRTAHWIKSLLPFSVLAVMTIGNGQISTIVMGLVTSPEEIGYMRIADRVSQLVVFSLLIVNLVSAPHLAERGKMKQWKELERLAVMAARGALIVALPVAIGLIALGESLIQLLFGEDYAEPVWPPLAIVCLGRLMNVYYGSISDVLNLSGHEMESIRGMALGLATNTIVTALLAPSYGAVGAAIGFSCSIWVWNFYLSIRLKKKLDIRVSAI